MARRDEHGGIADDLRDGTGGSRDDRDTEGHRFERGQAEPFVQRGVGEQARVRNEGAPVIAPPDPIDPGSVPGGSESGSQRVLAPTGRPGDLEADIGEGVGGPVEGGDEIGQALTRLHPPDSEDVRRIRLSTRQGRWQRSQPVVDDVHPIAIDMEVVHDIVRHGLGHRVDGGSLGDSPTDEAGIPQRCRAAHLGETHGSQVVHGHEPRRLAGRWHHEVRSVHDVDGAGPPFDCRMVETGPGPEQRVGRDRDPSRRPHRTGQLFREGFPGRCAESVPDDLKVGIRRNRRDEAAHGLAHTRAHPEQGRGVHRHRNGTNRAGHAPNLRE